MFNANHPYLTISTHPYFYTDESGYEDLQRHSLTIGHDVWLGANSIICPGCHRVGNGAIIAAGAVVTKAVPDYAIFAGNPAKVIKWRFDPVTIDTLLRSEWWFVPFQQIKTLMHEMRLPLNKDRLDYLMQRVLAMKFERS
jgi:hypothetical protein